MPLTFVLVEPQLPENMGAVARVMANFKVLNLRIVNPCCSPTHEKAIATATGADFLLKDAQIFDSVDRALADIQWVYGTCATQRHMIKRYSPIRQAMPDIIQQMLQQGGKTAILFGPERTGLSNEDHVRCRCILQIPVNPDFSSLNLAQAASLVAYEWFTASQKPQSSLHMGETQIASHDQVQSFLTHLEHQLDACQFWRVPHKKPIMWQNVQNIFSRMDLTHQEIQTLFGLIHSLQRHPPPHGD